MTKTRVLIAASPGAGTGLARECPTGRRTTSNGICMAQVDRANRSHGDTLAERIAPPAGFSRERDPAVDRSRRGCVGCPLKSHGAPVLLHTGQPKPRQDVHAAVVDIDVGAPRPAAMRRRSHAAERRVALRERANRSPSPSTTPAAPNRCHTRAGQPANGRAYRGAPSSGRRRPPPTRHTRVSAAIWIPSSSGPERHHWNANSSPFRVRHRGRRRFHQGWFSRPRRARRRCRDRTRAGEKRVLLAQSYMPAQSIHVLNNPASVDGLPWYDVADAASALVTPEWTFPPGSLKRWR